MYTLRSLPYGAPNNFRAFSTFSCGGGYTIGLKLAGFNVLGGVEIDSRMADLYTLNHDPQYFYNEDIRLFVKRSHLPIELYDLDLLEGSPPCTAFSMAGQREKVWNMEKTFNEGKAKQRLDDLFFPFIELTGRVKPKMFITENVKGLIAGEAKKLFVKIIHDFDKAGYFVRHVVMDSSNFGIPQRRQRVFIYGIRKDLVSKLGNHYSEYYRIDYSYLLQIERAKDININAIPYYIPEFNYGPIEPPLHYRDIEQLEEVSSLTIPPSKQSYWSQSNIGDTLSKVHPKGYFFNDYRLNPDAPMPTICASNNGFYHYYYRRRATNLELQLASSFPMDYNFKKVNKQRVIGMSVPPIMMAHIGDMLKKDYLNKIVGI